MFFKSMVSCQKGPTRHAYAWQIGTFWQDTLQIFSIDIPYFAKILTGFSWSCQNDNFWCNQ